MSEQRNATERPNFDAWHLAYRHWYDNDRAGHHRRAAAWGWVADQICRRIKTTASGINAAKGSSPDGADGMSETSSLYGLTHHCDDPECHVPGFVATLRTMRHPASDCGLRDCPQCLDDAPRPPESDALRQRLRADHLASSNRPEHEKRVMPAIRAALHRAADGLESQPPKLQVQHIAALRLYADEPWRLDPCRGCGLPVGQYNPDCCHVEDCQECVIPPGSGEETP